MEYHQINGNLGERATSITCFQCDAEFETCALKKTLVALQIELSKFNFGAGDAALGVLKKAQGQATRLGDIANHTCLSDRSKSMSGSAIAARKVFDVAELLEKILGDLNTCDLLSATQAYKVMADTIESSPSLLRKLCLKPDSNSYFATPFTEQSGLSFICMAWPNQPSSLSTRFWQDSQERDGGATITAQFETCESESPLPNLGSRCREMLICQPPVHSMNIIVECCKDSIFDTETSTFHTALPTASGQYLPPLPAPLYTPAAAPVGGPAGLLGGAFAGPMGVQNPRFLGARNQPSKATITSHTGITVGQLLDATDRLRQQHSLCPHAQQYLHRDDGTVRVSVRFESHTKLDYFDPIRVQCRRVRDEMLNDERKRTDDGHKLLHYMQVKGTAAANGQPIPTMAEVEATDATSITVSDV